jgi:hypothetical protein
MTYSQRNALFFLLVVIVGVIKLWPIGIYDGHINFEIQLITYINFVLFVTSIVCLKEFFLPLEANRTPFHQFNAFFIIVFYFVSLTFLINHRDFYDNYAHLSVFETIKRFSLRWDIFSVMFWINLFTLGVNIVYIARHRESYLQYS